MNELTQLRDNISMNDGSQSVEDNARAMLERITPKQREVLRLALVRKSSKEIARELNIVARSVDQRLDAARTTLGVSTRFEAARKFKDLVSLGEGLAASERLTSEPFMLGEGAADGGSNEGEQPLYVFGDALQFSPKTVWERSAEIEPDTWRQFVPGLPSAASGSRDRIMWIVIGALTILALVLVGLAVADSLTRLFGEG